MNYKLDRVESTRRRFETCMSPDGYIFPKTVMVPQPLIPQSITDEIMTKYSKQADITLCESAFAMPRKYIIKEDACILFWSNGTKTIVRKSKDEKFDKRLGFLTAYFQKHCGMSKTKANKFLDNLEVQE